MRIGDELVVRLDRSLEMAVNHLFQFLVLARLGIEPEVVDHIDFFIQYFMGFHRLMGSVWHPYTPLSWPFSKLQVPGRKGNYACIIGLANSKTKRSLYIKAQRSDHRRHETHLSVEERKNHYGVFADGIDLNVMR